MGAGLSIGQAMNPLSPLAPVNCSSAANTEYHRPKIGIISGSGPEAGLDILQKILLQHRTTLGNDYKTDKDAPNITLFQVPGLGGPHGAWDLDDRQGRLFQELWTHISETILQLSTAGVDCFCLPCNTLHLLEPDIRDWLHEQKEIARGGSGGVSAKMEFVSIIDAVVQAVLKDAMPGKISTVVLGTMVTTDPVNSPYASMPSRSDMLDIEELTQQMRVRLQKLIVETKRLGPHAECNRTEFWNILMDLEAAHDGSANRVVVLACSELPTLLDERQFERLEQGSFCRVVDPNVELARALLSHAVE
jgi:aspartate racemase